MNISRTSFFVRIISFLLILVFIIPVNVFAAVPETVQPLGSYYLSSYTSYICPIGGGDLQIWYRVTGTGMMADIGVLTIKVYESSDQSTWELVKTYRHTNYSQMLAQDTWQNMDYVYFQGTREYYYKALVTIWAGDEDNGDTRYMWTSVEQAY